MKLKRIAALALCALAGCKSSTASYPRPDSIAVCEVPSVTICGTWTRQGDQYVGTWEDGATANLTVVKFTSTEVQITRADYGKNLSFSATYTGVVTGSTAAGTVTWNHAGNVRTGTWTAEW